MPNYLFLFIDFKNPFFHHAGPVGQRHDGHDLGLHVRGKAGVGLRFDVRSVQAAVADGAHAFGRAFDLHAHALELEDDGFQLLIRAAAHQQIAAGDTGSRKERARLDAVGHDGIACAAQAGDALYRDGAAAVPFDACAAVTQKIGKVHHFRFARAVFQHGFPFGKRGGHEQIFRSAHGRHVKGDVGSLETVAASLNIAVLQIKVRAHLFQPLEVLIHGARADGATAGQSNARFADARQQRAEAENRRAHGTDQIIRGLGLEPAGSRPDYAAVVGAGAAENAQQGKRGMDVAQVGDIGKRHGTVQQNGPEKNRQGGIFGTADVNGAFQARAAFDKKFVHTSSEGQACPDWGLEKCPAAVEKTARECGERHTFFKKKNPE